MKKPAVMEPRVAKRTKLEQRHLDTILDLHLAMVRFNSQSPTADDLELCAFLAKELGDVMWPLLCMVIYADKGFEECEKTLDMSARSAKIVFKIALEQVEYRLEKRKT